MVNYTFSVLSFDEEAIVHLGKEAAAFLEIQDVRLVSLILTRLKNCYISLCRSDYILYCRGKLPIATISL